MAVAGIVALGLLGLATYAVIRDELGGGPISESASKWWKRIRQPNRNRMTRIEREAADYESQRGYLDNMRQAEADFKDRYREGSPSDQFDTELLRESTRGRTRKNEGDYLPGTNIPVDKNKIPLVDENDTSGEGIDPYAEGGGDDEKEDW